MDVPESSPSPKPEIDDVLIPNLEQQTEAHFPLLQDESTLAPPRTPSPNPSTSWIEPPSSPPPPSIREASTPVQSPSDVPELINPLDRPSSPDPPPYTEPLNTTEDLESIPLSRTSSHTLSLHNADEENSMSDWTEAFEGTESELASDFESDGDIVSDAESETSWAHVRSSRGVGMN